MAESSSYSVGVQGFYNDKGGVLIKEIALDLEVRLPHNHYGRIVHRSGIPLHQDICIRDAVIREDFQGDLIVVLYNNSENDLVITKGMRIAQLVVEKIIYPNIITIYGTLRNITGVCGNMCSSLSPISQPPCSSES
jgi:dUTPase